MRGVSRDARLQRLPAASPGHAWQVQLRGALLPLPLPPRLLPQKAADVFANIVPALAPNGVLYGVTIIGRGAVYNWFSLRLMGLYNKKGIFGNTRDSEEGLIKALGEGPAISPEWPQASSSRFSIEFRSTVMGTFGGVENLREHIRKPIYYLRHAKAITASPRTLLPGHSLTVYGFDSYTVILVPNW